MYSTLVVIFIAPLAVSAASIPRSRGKGNGIAIPLTKHSPSSNSNNSVDIDKLRSRSASYTAKILRGLENYERNTGTTHPQFAVEQSRNWKRAGAALDLATYAEDAWYGMILIGSPPKPFTVQLDTGISDLFIPASTGDAICKSHDHLWDPASSQTAKDLNKPFSIEFGDGTVNVQGKQYTDTITIAGLTADKQTFGVATAYSPGLDKSLFPPDGMLGLAFPSMSDYPASPLLETLFNEGKLSDRVFSLKLTLDGGEMYIGGVNKVLYSGDITFVDVQTKAYWEVMVDDIRVNGNPVLRNVVSVIDTGSNFIDGDRDRVLALHASYGGKSIVGTDWYTFPCDRFPDVTLTLAGKSFTLPAAALNLGPVVLDSPDCFSGIVGHDGADIPFWSIGSNFLRHYYTVFNAGSKPPQVGFAKLA